MTDQFISRLGDRLILVGIEVKKIILKMHIGTKLKKLHEYRH